MTTQVTSDVIADSAVTAAKVAAGAVVQVVSTQSGAMTTGTTTIPSDNTVPQNTEGTALTALDTAITPKSATNILLIQAVVNLSVSTAVQAILALFQDATAGALAAGDLTIGGAAQIGQVVISFKMTAGTTSATTFKLRFGGSAASTLTVNGSAGAQLFGGALISSLTITEIKA